MWHPKTVSRIDQARRFMNHLHAKYPEAPRYIHPTMIEGIDALLGARVILELHGSIMTGRDLSLAADGKHIAVVAQHNETIYRPDFDGWRPITEREYLQPTWSNWPAPASTANAAVRALAGVLLWWERLDANDRLDSGKPPRQPNEPFDRILLDSSTH